MPDAIDLSDVGLGTDESENQTLSEQEISDRLSNIDWDYGCPDCSHIATTVTDLSIIDTPGYYVIQEGPEHWDGHLRTRKDTWHHYQWVKFELTIYLACPEGPVMLREGMVELVWTGKKTVIIVLGVSSHCHGRYASLLNRQAALTKKAILPWAYTFGQGVADKRLAALNREAHAMLKSLKDPDRVLSTYQEVSASTERWLEQLIQSERLKFWKERAASEKWRERWANAARLFSQGKIARSRIALDEVERAWRAAQPRLPVGDSHVDKVKSRDDIQRESRPRNAGNRNA